MMFEMSMTVGPFKFSLAIVLLAIGFEVLVAYLIRQELKILKVVLEIVVPPLYRCGCDNDQPVAIAVFNEDRPVRFRENYCRACWQIGKIAVGRVLPTVKILKTTIIPDLATVCSSVLASNDWMRWGGDVVIVREGDNMGDSSNEGNGR
jgi:hypothetical protein